MSNEQTTLSRRVILAGSLAALTASPALATAALPGNDDSALIAMSQEWRKAWNHLLELYQQLEEAEVRAHAMYPKPPAALTKTEFDWEMGLCARPNHPLDATFNSELVNQLRRRKAHPPEAKARVAEIVAAWDQYRADLATAEEQSGFTRANKAVGDATEAVHDLEGRIARTRATTPAGMLAKARIVVTDPIAISTVDDLEQALEERLDAGQVMGLSLVLDILNMHGGQA